MPKDLMTAPAVCGDWLSDSQGHGSMLVAQEIRVSQFELEARGVWCQSKDCLSLIGESLAIFRRTSPSATLGFRFRNGFAGSRMEARESSSDATE
jgi:hypothetical protein